MQAIDIVKAEPKTELEAFRRWVNRLRSEYLLTPGIGKKIDIKYIDKITCDGDGRRYCEEQGEHSWFNHAMDTYRR